MIRRWLPWLRPLAGVTIVGLLVWRFGTEAFVAAFRLIDPTAILAALAIGLVTIVLSACRWWLIARRLGLRLRLHRAVADYYRAVFLNAVLPAGVLGDADRAVRHGRANNDLGRAVRAVVFERAGGQVVLVLAALVVLAISPSWLPLVTGQFDIGPVAAAVVVAAVAAAVLLIGWMWRGDSGSRRRRALADTVRDLRQGLLARDTWPGVMLLSAAALGCHLLLFVLAARTAGASAPFMQLLPIMLLALLVMAVPLNVGGWGPREAFSALAFGAVGLGAALGLTVAVTYGALAFISALPGAAVVLVRRRRRPKLAPVPA